MTSLAYDNTITVLDTIGKTDNKKLARAVETVKTEVNRLIEVLNTSKPQTVKDTEKEGKI